MAVLDKTIVSAIELRKVMGPHDARAEHVARRIRGHVVKDVT